MELIEEHESYIIYNFVQGSEPWFEIRKKLKATASKFSVAAGFTDRFMTREKYLRIKQGKEKEVFTEEAKQRMKIGELGEARVREWYERERKVKVREIGIAVPKWDREIGGSPDGLVGDEGLIEIKISEEVYAPLKERSRLKEAGIEYDRFDHAHIYENHYAQMQGCMAIMQKKWCDYIVFGHRNKEIVINRVYFNPEYWKDRLYPKLVEFKAMFEE